MARSAAAKSAAFRILHLNTAQDWRGGERQTFFLATELQRRGYSQLVVGQPSSALLQRCKAQGIDHAALRMRGELDPLAIRGLRTLVRQFAPTHLHAHTARAHALGLLARVAMPAAALIVSRRVDFPARPNLLSRWKYQTPLVTRYLAISQNVRRILVEDGIAPERIDIAYSGIDLKEYRKHSDGSALRRQLALRRGDILIGNAAALVGHKDHRTMLAAFARALARAPRSMRLRLVIFGEGPLRGALEAQARQLGLTQSGTLFMPGYRADIQDCYAAFDLFAISSNEEGLGTAVLDAMAHGLPVLGTTAGGIPEMVENGKGGLLSAAGDFESYARNMLALAADPKMRQRFGAWNRKSVRRFSKEATCDATLQCYQRALSTLLGPAK
ncbi:MAG: glycosyltransferase family 4 protein [Leptospirales bacterium]|nr:glycosyltransferase family 4 protein [Leptospirales bacterium]